MYINNFRRIAHMPVPSSQSSEPFGPRATRGMEQEQKQGSRHFCLNSKKAKQPPDENAQGSKLSKSKVCQSITESDGFYANAVNLQSIMENIHLLYGECSSVSDTRRHLNWKRHCQILELNKQWLCDDDAEILGSAINFIVSVNSNQPSKAEMFLNLEDENDAELDAICEDTKPSEFPQPVSKEFK